MPQQSEPEFTILSETAANWRVGSPGMQHNVPKRMAPTREQAIAMARGMRAAHFRQEDGEVG